jgi:hypothetical protein
MPPATPETCGGLGGAGPSPLWPRSVCGSPPATSSALAGGYAVQAHGILDRPSEDVDLFTGWECRGDFAAAVDAVVDAYREGGYTVEVAQRFETFAQLAVTDPSQPARSYKVELAANRRAWAWHLVLPRLGDEPARPLRTRPLGRIRVADRDTQGSGRVAGPHLGGTHCGRGGVERRLRYWLSTRTAIRP